MAIEYANISSCPIWGRDFQAEGYEFIGTGEQSVLRSDRAGGSYHITGAAAHRVERLTGNEKARLTTWIIDQRQSVGVMPNITEDTVEYALAKSRLPTHVRAMRLLKFLTRHTRVVSDQVELTVKYPRPEILPGGAGGSVVTGLEHENYNSRHLEAMAWTESIEHSEVFYLAEFLETEGLIIKNRGESGLGSPVNSYQVTVAGYKRIEELETNVDSSQAFVAMWFDSQMEEVYEKGIRPGIEDAGYKALRIDRKEHANKIDDEIIAEIRRSRFLLADFTQGPDGARGGVYYEAGFAEGLGLRVIYTCRQDMTKKLAFDTRQYNHITWATHEELRVALKNRIGSVMGDGPDAHGRLSLT